MLIVSGEGGMGKSTVATNLTIALHAAVAALLGQLPLDPRAREWGDAGTPIVQAAPTTDIAQTFVRIAERLADRISVANQASAASPAGNLVIDRSGGTGPRHLPLVKS